MSYILDALKRADTERERGAAPGLHTRHQMPAGNSSKASERRPIWVATAAGLSLMMLAVAFWFWRTPDMPPTAALTPAASPMPTTVEAAAPTVFTAPAPPLLSTAPAAAITPIAPVPIVVAQAPVAKAKPTEKTSPKAATTPPIKSNQPAAPTTSDEAVGAPTPASTAARPAATALRSELPTELRSQIPQITITGSVYSDSPAQRLLLVNNLVLAQGGQVTADLKLEEIQPRHSVFSYKGTRFRVMH